MVVLLVNIVMNKVAQIVQGVFSNDDADFVKGWKRYLNKLIIVEHELLADPEIPMIIPANPIGWVGQWMANKRPFFAVNRPYLGSWLAKKRFASRVSVNSFACTKLGNIPFTRWPTMQLDIEPWKVKEVKNVLIAPSKKSQAIFTGEDVNLWADRLKDFFESQGANVKIRPKVGKKGIQHWGYKPGGFVGLFGEDGDFEWADLVVSYSSAITAEAFWYGKKAISLGVCPTWVACDNHLGNWKDPIEPINRGIWHEHMAWIQFHTEEWKSGVAQDLTVAYQGWPTEVPHVNNEVKIIT